ncbi:MAG: ABC transporter ATP-binding protein [Propionibacteriaceae bacterium]|jgi:iron complex transport system ATP-binding protein|nr:ABC transporter ATP-binding protein [Propionibacteriaceae bacterium]
MGQVIEVSDVTVRRGRSHLLDHVSWSVDESDRWVIIGPNGAGKTTLVQLISARIFPTSGQVQLLDETMGRVDVFELRPRIGVASAILETQIPDNEHVRNVIMSASYAIFGRWNEDYTPIDFIRAEKLMAQLRVDHLAERTYGTLSEGERQRVQIARALMTDPEILVLDEPTAGLDLAGRELLLVTLTQIALDPKSPCSIMVTHHVEEIPVGVTHALFLKQGRVVAAGPLREVMTDAVLSRTFDLPLRVSEVDGRWRAQANLGAV